MTMEPKNAAEGPARVVIVEFDPPYRLHIFGQEVWRVWGEQTAYKNCERINRALAPLVAKAQWADAVAECLRYQVSVGIPISPAETSLLVKYAAIGGKVP